MLSAIPPEKMGTAIQNIFKVSGWFMCVTWHTLLWYIALWLSQGFETWRMRIVQRLWIIRWGSSQVQFHIWQEAGWKLLRATRWWEKRFQLWTFQMDVLTVELLGTMSYFFSLQDIQSRFEAEGFKTISNEYIYRETTNRKLEMVTDRIFTQCKFVKP